MEFSEQNHVLLKEFCEKRFKSKNLLELWSKLCKAVDTYCTKDTNDVE